MYVYRVVRMALPQAYRDRDVDGVHWPLGPRGPRSARRLPIRGGKNAIRPANTIYRGVRIALLNKYIGTLKTSRLYRVTLHFNAIFTRGAQPVSQERPL